MLSLKAANRRTYIFVGIGIAFFALLGYYRSVHEIVLQPAVARPGNARKFSGRWNYQRDADNLILNSHQCEQAFPGLFEEVERPVKDRWNSHITVEELDSLPQQNGYVRAMIYDQQVRVKHFNDATSECLPFPNAFAYVAGHSSTSSQHQVVSIHADSPRCTRSIEP